MAHQLKDGVLTIDLGSTSLRAGILVFSCSRQDLAWHKIHCPYTSANYIRFKAFEWPIMLDALSANTSSADGSIWMTTDTRTSMKGISAKFAMYRLVDSKPIRDQYCVAAPLFARKDPGLCARLRQGIRELFRALHEEVEETCHDTHVKINRIALAIPSQWDGSFQDEYRAIVSEIFDITHIEFVKEVEAIAHYMFQDNLSKFWKARQHIARQLVLFLDFGGHSMNSCMYIVVYDPARDKMPCIYIDEDSKGEGGGSEHWEYYMIEACKAIWRQGGHKLALNADDLRQISDRINSEKQYAIGPSYNKDLRISFQKEDDKSYTIKLSHETIKACFDKAFQRPLNAAQKQIEHMETEGGGLVVVSGGSSRHRDVRESIKELCKTIGLPEKPIFVADKDDAAAKVFTGAGYAVGMRTTAREFMAGGAAFALQKSNSGSHAHFLISQKQPHGTIDMDISGDDELRIVCDPFYESRKPTNGNGAEPVLWLNTYPILQLGDPKEGTLTVDLTLYSPEDEEDDAAREHSALHAAKGAAKCGASTSELCLAIKLWHTGKKSGEAQAEKVFLDTFLTNVYINDGSNCAFLEIQDEEDNPLRALVDCSPRQKGPKRRKRIPLEDRPWHPTNSSRPKAGPPRTKRATIPTTTAPAPSQPETRLGFQPEAEGGDLHAVLPNSQPRIAGQIQEQEPPQRPRRSLAVVSYSEIAEISSDDEQGPTDRPGVAVRSPSAATLPISTDLRTRDDDAAAIIRNEPDPDRSFSFVSRRYQPSSASSRAEEDVSCHTRHSGVSE
ncbi:hypothetical protein MN608_08865 [Microdochium nivale]|nr:hypothetical protein MN608_08865 [Microdochium nivale]